MDYSCKNYTEQGGEKTVIGGILEFKPGAKIIGPLENQADSTAATVSALKDDLNALLAKLKEVGLMAADEET